MKLPERIAAFSFLGKAIDKLLESNGKKLIEKLHKTTQCNGWFTEENARYALKSISQYLTESKLQSWLSRYKIPANFNSSQIAIILPGNIPLVGFHDVLCVLISGHKVLIKQSTKDTILLPFLLEILVNKFPDFQYQIKWINHVLPKDYDAVIATGSNSSAHYFENYFGHLPYIIRKNRTSIAVITENTSPEELKNMGKDIFTYFGLGCRNVSKLFIPDGFNISKLRELWVSFKKITYHDKYLNNYTYQKIINLMNNEKHHDFDFILLKKSSSLFSPVGVLYYEVYKSIQNVENYIEKEKENIQCIVGKHYTPFGESQTPQLTDYADGIDTMNFFNKFST